MKQLLDNVNGTRNGFNWQIGKKREMKEIDEFQVQLTTSWIIWIDGTL